jgi:hypothetical protein
MEGLSESPAGDFGMVPLAQDLRHDPTPKIGRAGELGLFKQAFGAKTLGNG